MIKISAWQRLCVYSPEVTGSCLLTSVASTMEPRKVRTLKVLTGFRRVSDPLPSCLKSMARPCKKRTKRETQRKERNSTKTRLLSMSKSIVKGKLQEAKASKECLNWIYKRCEKPRTPAPGSQNTAKKEALVRNSKQGMEPKQLLILGACKSKTPCAMIQTSAWQRLCVCSPEVTGSCLVTSVACTMEPRKIRKLKVLTGFRPVSDPLPRCFRTLFFFLLLAFFF